jgi:hypothetical protein
VYTSALSAACSDGIDEKPTLPLVQTNGSSTPYSLLRSRDGVMLAVEFMTKLLGIGCIGLLVLSADTRGRWRLPATIEALQDVPAQSIQRSHQLRGVLYVAGEGTFTIEKGQRFLMVKVYDEGECRIKFKNREYDVSSCPWLDGFTDHQENVFKVVSGALSSPAPAAQDQQWGPPVDGVQLRLALSPNGSPYLPSDLPLFEVQLRNRGVEPVSYQIEAIVFGELEIDGIRYREAHVGSCCSAPQPVAAGTDSDVSPMRVIRTQTFQLNSTPAGTLVLTPGAHVMRVTSVAGQYYDIHTATRRSLVLTSNSVTFNMPALSAAAERQALIAQASSGGTRGLPAARTLIAKYPDAAVEAVRQAVAATSDAGLRGEYVRLAGIIPGDAVVPFLQRQVLPDAGLFSQVQAAVALLVRGRSDWLAPLLDAWRDHQQLGTTTSELDAQAQLIAFLAGSGDADAVDALGRIEEAPVDVRLAVVEAFLPPAAQAKSRSGKGPSVSMMSRPGAATLPGGAAGVAIDRLLSAALDDRSQRIGVSAKFDDLSYEDPRVCDMAAFVFATRWPDRFRFTWPATLVERDAQIEVIRRARQEGAR